MAKSKIIKELVNEEISLTIALKRLKLFARNLGNKDLLYWVDKELIGYNQEDDIPEYRVINSSIFLYSGINGDFKVNNQPLNIGWFSKETREKIITLKVFQSISIIEEDYQNNAENLMLDRSYLKTEIKQNSKQGWKCIDATQISQIFSPSQFKEIIINIHNKVLDIFIELEEQFGCLDQLDIPEENITKEKVEEFQKFVQINIVNEDKSIHLNNSQMKNSQALSGDSNTSSNKDKYANTGSGSNKIDKKTEIDSTLTLNKSAN